MAVAAPAASRGRGARALGRGKPRPQAASFVVLASFSKKFSRFHIAMCFPECVARVPVSFGGLGVRLCSRKVVSVRATVRNRSQPPATVCVSAVTLSTVASASGLVLKACEVDPLSP